MKIKISHKPISALVIGLTTLAVSTFACSEPDIKPLVTGELGKIFNTLANNNSSTLRSVKLSKNLIFKSSLEGTNKGNGSITIHNLHLRLFDQHDDGVVYEGNSLKLDLKDITGDNINELIISGIIKYTGDDEAEPASYEPFTQIYTFDCSKGQFISLYRNGTYSIELAANAVKAVECK